MTNAKYIYIAANNMADHPLYKKSFILGEADDLRIRQMQYNKMQKGFQKVHTGDLISMDGQDGLPFPFIDCMKFLIEVPHSNSKNRHDTVIHSMLTHEKPFTDFIYNVKDKSLMNTKEAYAFYNSYDFIRDIERIKEFIIDRLTDGSGYALTEFKYK